MYGKQRGNQNTQYAERRVFAQWFPDQSNFQQKHPFCNNANAAIRRTLWQQQPYNEELTGLEDLEWANRIIDIDYYLAYSAEAQVIHVHNETPVQTYNRYRREAIAFKHIFPFEHFHFCDFIRLWIANVFSDYKDALQSKGQKRGLLSIPRFRLMQFWGTYRGYFQHKPLSQQLRRTFYYPNSQQPIPSISNQKQTDLRIHYDEVNNHHL